MKYVDELKSLGKLDKTRLVVPGFKQMRKWLVSLFHEQNVDGDDFSDPSSVQYGQA